MSPFSTCENSCAITPCNSSRDSRVSVPRVTAITASLIEWPAANALIAVSLSITYTRGTATPDAIAISSTTLIRRRSSKSRVVMSTSRASTRLATAAPPALSEFILYSVPLPIRPSTMQRVDKVKAGRQSRGGAGCSGRHQEAEVNRGGGEIHCDDDGDDGDREQHDQPAR